MNKSMLLAVTITGVTTSAGAAYAGVSAVLDTAPASPAGDATTLAVDTTVPGAPVSRTISYQVGPAGQVTLTVADGVLSIAAATPGDGWSVATSGSSGAHAEVQFTDGQQLVTFSADLTGADVVVSVTSELLAGADSTLVGAPIDVTIIGDNPTPAPQPAPTPGSDPTVAPLPPTTVPPNTVPPSNVSAPSSGSHDDDGDDGYEDDEDEDDGEYEDHDDENDDEDHDADEDHEDDEVESDD